MRWTSLGHATWLAEVAGLRILFDPVLGPTHAGGVFETTVPRRVDVRSLRPDFIFVSHAHPDHFDPASLHELAKLDADSVVVTSDPLVVETASGLGFRSVRAVSAGFHIRLDGVDVVTTPSIAEDPEWGAVVSHADGFVWNQIDSVPRDARDLARILSSALRATSSERTTPSLVLARWQPLLEIAVSVGERVGFPFEVYEEILGQALATQAPVIAASSAGVRHTAAYDALNAYVYPLTAQRFCRDLEARGPVRAIAPRPGDRVDVEGGRASLVEGGGRDVCDAGECDDEPRYAPLGLPAVTDEALAAERVTEARRRIASWVHDGLAPALARAYPSFGASRRVRLSLDVVGGSFRDGWTFDVGGDGCEVRPDLCPDYDVLDVVAASMLDDVLRGTRHWGEPLLAGCLRAVDRAYEVDAVGLRRLAIAPIFLYYALPYAESVSRWARAEVARLRRPA